MNETNTPLFKRQLLQITELASRRQFAAAEQCCLDLLQVNSDNLMLWKILLNLYYRQRKFETLVENFETQFDNFKQDAALVSLFANALRYTQNAERAASVLTQFLKKNPGKYRHYNQLGLINKERGKESEAVVAFEQCLSIKPDYCEALWHKLSITRQLSSEEIARLSGLLIIPNISRADSIYAHFCLFTHFDLLGEYALAFTHLSTGNRLRHAQTNYDHAGTCQEYRTIQQYFSQSKITELEDRIRSVQTDSENTKKT